MGCAGPKATVEQQLKSATNAGFSLHDAITIVSISQAESCGGQVYSTGPDNGPGVGVPVGNLQFIPANQNLGGCNLLDTDPQKALDCNFKTAHALYQKQGFCAWATYSDSTCPSTQQGRANTYAQFVQPTYNTLLTLTHGGNDPLEVAGGAIQSSPPGQLVGNAASGIGNLAGNVSSGVGSAVGTVEHSIQNLGSGVAALTKPFQLIADFFKEPKVAFARILLFILGIFIAFEAVKHLSGSNQNLVVVGAQNAGKATFGKKAVETVDVT